MSTQALVGNRSVFARGELLELLSVRGTEQAALFAAARERRRLHFGRRARVRGVVEITNRCRVECGYCPMRRDNDALERSMLGAPEVIAAVEAVHAAGLDQVLIQGGEVPQTTPVVAAALPTIKRLGLYALLNLGIKTRPEYQRLRELGADGYLMKFETTNPVLHQRFRNEGFARRREHIDLLLELGFEVSTGSIVGLPDQTLEDVADDLLFAQSYGERLKMLSVSPFIPAAETPLAGAAAADLELTLNALALLRLIQPAALIPTVSALKLLSAGAEDGQVRGFDAGATNITVNFTPNEMREQYRIYTQQRFVVELDYARRAVAEAGLSWEPATAVS